jgi:hypothetical protein
LCGIVPGLDNFYSQGGVMSRKELLEQTKIGEYLTIGCVLEEEEIGFFMTSYDISTSCSLTLEEWDRFVEGINTAYSVLKETQQ